MASCHPSLNDSLRGTFQFPFFYFRLPLIFTTGEGFDYFSDRHFSAIVSINGLRIFRAKVSDHVYWSLRFGHRPFLVYPRTGLPHIIIALRCPTGCVYARYRQYEFGAKLSLRSKIFNLSSDGGFGWGPI